MPSSAETDRAPAAGALHENLFREDEPAGSSDRTFGLTISAVFGVIGGMRLVFGHNYAWRWIGAAAVLAMLGIFLPGVLSPFNRAWSRLGMLLYKIVNPVVMTLLFCTAIVPVGLLMRLFGKDPLRLRRQPEAASYWIVRDPPGPAPATMRDQF
jgi:Saxitoxin biosynthesis operon protein SxtJ